jgi:hypothetical protein
MYIRSDCYNTYITVTAATAQHIIVSQMYLLLLLLLRLLLLLVILSTMDNRANISYNISLCSRVRSSIYC